VDEWRTWGEALILPNDRLLPEFRYGISERKPETACDSDIESGLMSGQES
jgi:hypothetical protein